MPFSPPHYNGMFNVTITTALPTPPSASAGDFVYDTTAHRLLISTSSTAWDDVVNEGAVALVDAATTVNGTTNPDVGLLYVNATAARAITLNGTGSPAVGRRLTVVKTTGAGADVTFVTATVPGGGAVTALDSLGDRVTFEFDGTTWIAGRQQTGP